MQPFFANQIGHAGSGRLYGVLPASPAHASGGRIARDVKGSVCHGYHVDDEFDLMVTGMATRTKITNSLANSWCGGLSGRKVKCPELKDFGRSLAAGTRIMDTIIHGQTLIIGGSRHEFGINIDRFAKTHKLRLNRKAAHRDSGAVTSTGCWLASRECG